MSIFDRFKTRRTRESQDQKQQLLTKVQQAALREKTKAVTAKATPTKVAVAAEHNNTKAQNTGVKRGQAWQVLKGPHITERATELAERHLYVFKVAGFAKSAQVAHAVSEVYGVNVKKARVINISEQRIINLQRLQTVCCNCNKVQRHSARPLSRYKFG